MNVYFSIHEHYPWSLALKPTSFRGRLHSSNYEKTFEQTEVY